MNILQSIGAFMQLAALETWHRLSLEMEPLEPASRSHTPSLLWIGLSFAAQMCEKVRETEHSVCELEVLGWMCKDDPLTCFHIVRYNQELGVLLVL